MNEQKTITIKEALGFPESTPIGRMVGKVTHLFDRKTGEGDYGPYSSQSGVISDGEDKILFTVWNKPEIPHDYKGRVVIFRAGSGKKVSMSLKSDFKDPTKRTLNVTKSCIMLTEDEETDDIPMDYPKEDGFNYKKATEGMGIEPNTGEPFEGKPEPRERTKSSSKPIVATTRPIPASGVQDVKHRVMQLVNLRFICDSAARSAYPSGGGEFVKEIGTSIFIQATRENLHDKLPNNKPIDDKATKGKPEEKEPEFLPAEEF